jgi:hypothetical protein
MKSITEVANSEEKTDLLGQWILSSFICAEHRYGILD